MNTLTLFPSEQKIFHSLSDALQEGWIIETETLTYTDTPQKQMMRLSLLRIHDPDLLELREKAMLLQSMDEVMHLVGTMDIKKVDEDDMAQLFFALGPDIITRLIIKSLQEADSDVDLEGIAGLSVIRHSILFAFHSVHHG